MRGTALLFLCFSSVFANQANQTIGCPDHCTCFDDESFKTANCSTSVLTSHNEPSHIDVLNLFPYRPLNSSIKLNFARHTSLVPKSFKHFRTVKFLNLSHTYIKFLPNDVFYGMRSVIEIDLSHNKIKHLNGVVFKDLESLQRLILQDNPLLLTSFNVIISPSLQDLDLSYCNLREIPAGTFSNVNRLAIVNLKGNYLYTLGYHSIPSGTSYLNLANNAIINVPIEVFKSLRSLTRLDLSENPINCTCSLLLFQDWFSGKGRIFENGVTCSLPSHYSGQQLSRINENEICTKESHDEINSIKHLHQHHRKYYEDLQSDDPYSGRYGRIDTEVMFTDDDTNSMGTHMELSDNKVERSDSWESQNNESSTDTPDSGESGTEKENEFESEYEASTDVFNSSRTESPDYNYDTQHDYPTDNTSPQPESEFPSEEPFEGSGFSSTTEDLTSVVWMEEHENDTSLDFSVENVTNSFTDSTESTNEESTESTTEESTEPSISTELTWESFWGSSTTETNWDIIWGSSTTESSQTSEGSISSSIEPETSSSTEPETSSSGSFSLFDIFYSRSTEPSESSTESSSPSEVAEEFQESTTLSEVEVLDTINFQEKENIMDSSLEMEEEDKTEKIIQSSTIYIIAGIVIILLTVLILVSVCRRRKKRQQQKVRLGDAEANTGTEMNMLLPKPRYTHDMPVVVPKFSNGNGNANANSNGKSEHTTEEVTPVLPQDEIDTEPEPDWEDKPAPVETVTARLSVLARPQTPIFIHKSIN